MGEFSDGADMIRPSSTMARKRLGPSRSLLPLGGALAVVSSKNRAPPLALKLKLTAGRPVWSGFSLAPVRYSPVTSLPG